MNNSSIFKRIMQDYDRDRQSAERLKKSRLEEIYKAQPRVYEIDRQLTKTSLALAKAILNNENVSVKDMEAKNKEYSKERKELIKQAGFKKNYLDDIYKCSKCKDTGFIENARCACLSQKLIAQYYDMSTLGNVLKKENFDNFDFQYYSDEIDPAEGISPKSKIQAIYSTCIEFVKNFDTSSTNLLFYGKAGLGKTFACNCIAKDVLDMGKTVLYATASRLFKTVEDARFNRDEMEEPDAQIDFFYSVDLLIIDDLGTEFTTLATQTALFNIINSRMLDNRHTIISTNLAPKDYEVLYSDRLVSRLQGNYTFCKFLGEDIRTAKKYAFKNQ